MRSISLPGIVGQELPEAGQHVLATCQCWVSESDTWIFSASCLLFTPLGSHQLHLIYWLVPDEHFDSFLCVCYFGLRWRSKGSSDAELDQATRKVEFCVS